MSDERFDARIDEVAREMTRGELPPDFRARVIARIERGDEGRWTWRPVWLLAPLAVAAALLLAVVVVRAPWRPAGRVAQGVGLQVPGNVGLRPDQTDATETSRTPATLQLKPDTTSAVRLEADATSAGNPDSERTVIASELAPTAIQIESLGVDAMESMDIGPLSVDAMESIDVPRLDVTPLEVPAIGEQ